VAGLSAAIGSNHDPGCDSGISCLHVRSAISASCLIGIAVHSLLCRTPERRAGARASALSQEKRSALERRCPCCHAGNLRIVEWLGGPDVDLSRWLARLQSIPHEAN
jgi:hypothetical protein